MKQYPKVKELNRLQKGHLAWRLDHHTYCGFISAGRVSRGESGFGEKRINEVFENFEMTKHQAKIHATKVVNFELPYNDLVQLGLATK